MQHSPAPLGARNWLGSGIWFVLLQVSDLFSCNNIHNSRQALPINNVVWPSWFLPSCAMKLSTFEAFSICLHLPILRTASRIPVSDVTALSAGISVSSSMTGCLSNSWKWDVMVSFDGISLRAGLLCSSDGFCLLVFQKADCISCWQFFSCVLIFKSKTRNQDVLLWVWESQNTGPSNMMLLKVSFSWTSNSASEILDVYFLAHMLRTLGDSLVHTFSKVCMSLHSVHLAE